MTIQTAGGLEVSSDSLDSRKFADKAKDNVFIGYSLVDVVTIYNLPCGITGAKLGTQTTKRPDGTYKVPVIWANGNATEEVLKEKGIGKRPYEATKFMDVPYEGAPTGHRLLYLI